MPSMLRRCARPEWLLIALAACGGGDEGPVDTIDAAPADALPDAGCGPDPSECPSQEACDRGECLDIPFFICEDGVWQEVICEGPWVEVIGTWTMTQTIVQSDATCPALVPRDPLVLTVDATYAVTAEPPISITAATATPLWSEGHLDATLTDDWQGVAPTIDYQLRVDDTGAILGEGTLTVDTCTATLVVTGTLTAP